jgi:hypothetical protein
MVDPIAIQAAVLRAQAPDLVLRPGMRVIARVLERHEGRGLIALASATLVAELPENVKEGDRLRLQVEDTSSDRVLLRMVPDVPPQATPPLPLPGEPRVRVEDDEAEDEGGGRGAGTESIALSYESPRLGTLRLRLEIASGAVRATVGAAPGRPHDLAAGAAERLRDALAGATGREASVRVEERREPIDVYA